MSEQLTWPDLKAKAAELGIPLERSMTREVIEKLVKESERKGVASYNGLLNADRPPVGYARVIIHKNPDPKASTADWWGSVNGYACLVAKGKEVDIPIKILRGSLMTAVTTVERYNDQTKEYYSEDVPSFPFTVIMITEGKDPRHYQHENNNKKKNRSKKIFWKKYGYYPKPKELREWIAGGGLENATEEANALKAEANE